MKLEFRAITNSQRMWLSAVMISSTIPSTKYLCSGSPLILVMDGIRDEHPADIGQGFDARRNVDAVAVEVAALDDHVAEVDADAKLHAVVGPMPAFRSGIASCMSSAQRTAATALANSTSRPSPVVLNAAAMLGDFRIEKLAAQRFKTFERAFLVRPVSREYPTTSAARIAASRRSSAISPSGVHSSSPKD